MVKILMIEDDAELAQILTDFLKKYNIEIENFEDPYLGLSALNIKKYDLLILDLSLPGLDGLDVCKEVTKKFSIPIIISSARSDVVDKIIALEIGADDYLPKPYDPRELESRIRAVLRRYGNKPRIEEKKDEKFQLNKNSKEVKKNSVAIKLTLAEYEILEYLMERKNYVLSKEDLLDNVMAISAENNMNSLAVLINRIRSKIEDDPKNPKHLLTVRGMGYKFSD